MKKAILIMVIILLTVTIFFGGRKTLFTFDLFIPALSDLYGTFQFSYDFSQSSSPMIYSAGAGIPFVTVRVLDWKGSFNLEVLVASNKSEPVLRTDFRIGSYDFKIFISSKLWEDGKFYAPFWDKNLNFEGGLLWGWYRGYIKLGFEYAEGNFKSLMLGVIY